MSTSKSDIIARLRKEILPLEGLSNLYAEDTLDLGLGKMKDSFPNHCFPLGAIHEFISDSEESSSASTGFILGLISGLIKKDGVCIWISNHNAIFPPSMKMFGIEPTNIFFITLKKEKDLLWATEEALKCKGIQAVISETSELSFPVSRRLQLAVEQSHVTGFIIRNKPKNLFPNACVSRWNINPLPSYSPNQMPGVGFPHWLIDLQKIRNGIPGKWKIIWRAGQFHQIENTQPFIHSQQKRKIG